MSHFLRMSHRDIGLPNFLPKKKRAASLRLCPRVGNSCERDEFFFYRNPVMDKVIPIIFAKLHGPTLRTEPSAKCFFSLKKPRRIEWIMDSGIRDTYFDEVPGYWWKTGLLGTDNRTNKSIKMAAFVSFEFFFFRSAIVFFLVSTTPETMWPDVSGVRPARRFFWKLFFFLSVKRFRAIASRHFRSTWTPCPVWVTSFLTTPWLKAADREHVGHDPTFSLFFFLIFAQTSVSGTVPKIKRKEKKRKENPAETEDYRRCGPASFHVGRFHLHF